MESAPTDSSSTHTQFCHVSVARAPQTHHGAAAVAGVLQVVVQQLGGSVLEGLGQRSQQHGELGRVELEQGDQHHLGRLQEEDGG